ncbi:hypothetical protein RLEG12_07900 (plasmid) [Rhizobium leguminosarum bv. trifolii CB782]|nr:hypothetical protein RLEG12_07900 [Rhizobium leguminosarum bv. trifolii CB782]
MIAFLAAGLLGCDQLGFREWHWNQKITLTVETPEGVRTGSSVQSVTWYESPTWARIGDSGGWFSHELHGEAAVVELAPNKYLFALMKTYDDPAANRVFRPERGKSRSTVDPRSEIRAENDAIESSNETRQIPRDSLPKLVTFTDPSNPSTAQEVSALDLEGTFGKGYRLMSIQLTITPAPRTSGNIVKVLGPDFFKLWAVQFEANFKSAGAFSARPFAFRIARDDFMTGG